jgi:hypothetical protein
VRLAAGEIVSRNVAVSRGASCALVWKAMPMSTIPTDISQSESEAGTLLNRPARVRPDDARNVDVRAVLAMSPVPDRTEVYIGWGSDPVSVALRRNVASSLRWEVAAPLLHERVTAAIAPLMGAGWHLDGTLAVAIRWDMSRGEGGDLYEGCWVRLRR